MLGYDPEGERGTSKIMPDKIVIHEPKEVVPEQPQSMLEPAGEDLGNTLSEEAAPRGDMGETQEFQAYDSAYKAPADSTW